VLLLCAAPALATTAVAPRISPKIGTPKTVFRVGFTAPEAAGHEGVVERSYSVELVAAHGRNCTHSVGEQVDKASAGERVRVSLRGRYKWCQGRGHGTIYQQEGPYCPDHSQPCPLFPSTSKPIARFAFRVR
jgi:hypothetical protein